jgi:cytochrome P450
MYVYMYALLKFSQTSNTLSWTLYCLATNPGVQEKLRREVEEIVGSDELVTPQHIARMPYLHDCIRETQR